MTTPEQEQCDKCNGTGKIWWERPDGRPTSSPCECQKEQAQIKNKSILTVDKLKKNLKYDPETGDFTWIVRRGGVKSGTIAGHINQEGYRAIRLDGVVYFAHRLAFLYMTGKWPDNLLDHINRDRKDNRFANLRIVTPTLSNFNRSRQINNKSGYNGVRLIKGKWQAYIKKIYLGTYKTKEEAAVAYDNKAIEITNGFYQRQI